MPSPSHWLRDSPGALIPLFRAHADGLTKLELSTRSGLSRTAVNQRVEALLTGGYLAASPAIEGGRGRPADRFTLSQTRGVTLVAASGATGMSVAICTPLGRILQTHDLEVSITMGPEVILRIMVERFDALLAGMGKTRVEVLALALSVPGPVDHASGRVISPPIMTGWHDFDIVAFLTQEFPVPVFVEKDTNAMAYGEYQAYEDLIDNMVFVKLGTGIGTGLILDGRIYRGSDGSAGDIGHVPLHGELALGAPACRCGKVGCVEAYAGGWALARDLTSAGYPASSVADVVQAARNGQTVALNLVRKASEIIGHAVSDIVNMFNPRLVVFGGTLATLDDIVLATAREIIYGRSLPLATRNLKITSSQSPHVAVHGLAAVIADNLHSPEAVDRELALSIH